MNAHVEVSAIALRLKLRVLGRLVDGVAVSPREGIAEKLHADVRWNLGGGSNAGNQYEGQKRVRDEGEMSQMSLHYIVAQALRRAV